MVLSGVTLSAKFSSTTLRTLVKDRRLCFTSSSDVAAEAPMMLGPYMPPSNEQTKTIAGATRNERRRAAKWEPPQLQYRRNPATDGRNTVTHWTIRELLSVRKCPRQGTIFLDGARATH